MARRYKALHFGNMDGKNVVYHREHRSKRGRNGLRGMSPLPEKGHNKNDWRRKDYTQYKPPGVKIKKEWRNNL